MSALHLDLLHLGLLAASVSLLGITAAASEPMRRREATLPALGYVTGTGLTVGNAACLLPSTPPWYSALLVALSVAGMLWFVASVVSAGPRVVHVSSSAHRLGQGRLEQRGIQQGMMEQGMTEQEVLQPVILHVVHEPNSQPSIEPPRAIEPPREEHAATQETFDAASTSQGWTAAGQGSYVAAHIERYVDGRGSRRPHGSYSPRRGNGEDPTARFLKLSRAYDISHPGRPRRSFRA